MNETDLNNIFRQATATTPADQGAAKRFLDHHRSRRKSYRHRLSLVSLILASAAAFTGTTILISHPNALPSSAAYDAYNSIQGDGW